MRKVASVLVLLAIPMTLGGCKKKGEEPPPAQPGYGAPGQYPQQPGQYPQQPGQAYPQQPGQYPQQPGQAYPQQPGQYPQQPGQAYPQQPGQYPQQPGQAYPPQPAPVPAQPVPGTAQPAPAPGQAPSQGGMSEPDPRAFPCTADGDLVCGAHRCNVAAGKCAWPCQSPADCQPGNQCVATLCVPMPQ